MSRHFGKQPIDYTSLFLRIPPKSIIEGPPPRLCPILLRQTSFKALEERIVFPDVGTLGHHTARFGEIESRGAAPTRKGRALFDELFQCARAAEVEPAGGTHVELREDGAPVRKESENEVHQRHLQGFFDEFPDEWEVLRQRGLVYFYYQVVPGGAGGVSVGRAVTLRELIVSGRVSYKPLVYEDFL